MRQLVLVDQRVQDLRFAVRQLLKQRGFACTAIVVLTLGLAGGVTIFSFVDAALIRPLPYRDPSRLVTVFGASPDSAARQIGGPVSYLDFVDWRTRNQAFESIAAYDLRGGFTVTMPSGPQRVPGLRVSAGFFHTLGVTPVLGREFLPEEEGVSAPPAVMLSYGTWQTRFGGNADVLGRTVTLQSPWLAAAEPHVIVGVLPPDFHFTLAAHAELWATIRGRQACWDVRSCRSLQTVARLGEDVSAPAAAANMTAIVERLRQEHPADHREAEIAKLMPLRGVMLGNVRPILLMLLTGAGLLLAIACINVVSLLLARSEQRRREIAVRQALGASGARLAMQFATEAVLLAAIPAVLGLVLATWLIRFLVSLLTADMVSRMPYLQSVGVNARLVAFAAGAALMAAFVFALAPASRVPIAASSIGLGEASQRSGLRWRWFGAHLVVAELAVAVVLLVGAGLLGRSLHQLLHVHPGFNPRGLATISVTPVSVRSGAAGDAVEERPGVLAREVAERIGALPGVESVGYADLLPLAQGIAPSSAFWVPGRAESEQVKAGGPVRRVGAGYFETLQATLVRGRYFTNEEVATARRVIVINETTARRHFPDDDPIGRAIAFGGPSSPAREIIGVVADIKDGPPETPALPSAYVPFDQTEFALVIRTRESGRASFASLAAAVREVRPTALVGGVSTMAERVNRLPSTSFQRSSAWLIGGFAAVALVLSIVGLYGVIAYSVSQRAREIGVRMALGAQQSAVYRLILGEASWLVGAGTVLGLVAAAIAAMLGRTLLFGVTWWDPPTLAAAAAVLVGSALAASYVPARRAASVNPIEVLRAE